MEAKYTQHVISWAPPKVIAQAYGSDTYSGNTYNGSPETSATATVPNTGFFAEPPVIIIPTLLIVAIIIGSISFAITRAIRRHHRK